MIRDNVKNRFHSSPASSKFNNGITTVQKKEKITMQRAQKLKNINWFGP